MHKLCRHCELQGEPAISVKVRMSSPSRELSGDERRPSADATPAPLRSLGAPLVPRRPAPDAASRSALNTAASMSPSAMRVAYISTTLDMPPTRIPEMGTLRAVCVGDRTAGVGERTAASGPSRPDYPTATTAISAPVACPPRPAQRRSPVSRCDQRRSVTPEFDADTGRDDRLPYGGPPRSRARRTVSSTASASR